MTDYIDVSRKVFNYLTREMVSRCAEDEERCHTLREFLSLTNLAKAMFIKFSIGESPDPVWAAHLIANLEGIGQEWIPPLLGAIRIRDAAQTTPVEIVSAMVNPLHGEEDHSVSDTLIALAAKLDIPLSERPPLPILGDRRISALGIAG